MIAQQLLHDRREQLRSAIRASAGRSLHVDGFVTRLLASAGTVGIARATDLALPQAEDAILYGGYPALALLGYGLGAGNLNRDAAGPAFLLGLRRLRQRPEQALSDFLSDDIALLGVADGLAALRDNDSGERAALRNWLITAADVVPAPQQWSSRLRALAGDLLDNRGRLRVPPNEGGADAMAVDYALRPVYPARFAIAPVPSDAQRTSLLKALISESEPAEGEPDRAAVWLVALEEIVDAAISDVAPAVSDAVRLLTKVQHALKRWPWKDKPSRRGVALTRWLIDDEYDVQALLWAMLYPVYGSDLVDETYLPGWGNVQPRADLGIIKMKLIIEVKIARGPSDYADIEEQVAGDLGLYFKETDRFDRMVVFVYDDCDLYRPERVDGLRNALRQRERIEDVVVVRRPSVIPNRNDRA